MPDLEHPRDDEPSSASDLPGSTRARAESLVAEIDRLMDWDTAAPDEDAEVLFPTAAAYVAEHHKRTLLNRTLKRADLLEQSKTRIWSNMTIRVCCSDGRIGQADFVDAQMSPRSLAHKYAPQAGCLLVSGPDGIGLGALRTEEDLRALYERDHDRIDLVLRDRFADDIQEELAWQRRFVERAERKIASLERFLQEARIGGRTDDDPTVRDAPLRIQELRAQVRTVRTKELRIVFESHSDSSDYIAHPMNAEARAASARHGCGAHGNDMHAALTESLKQAYLAAMWIERDAPFAPEDAARIRVVRMHNFTREQRLVLSTELDDLALNAAGDIVALDPELRAMGARFVPGVEGYTPPLGRGMHAFSRKDVHEHREPRVLVSMDHFAHLMPGVQALELTPGPDLLHTVTIERVLLGIMDGNYGASHPEAPLLWHVDAREIPPYELHPHWRSNEAQVAFKRGEITAMDALATTPPLVELEPVPLEDPAALEEIVRKNAREREERDAQLWYVYALLGRKDDAEPLIAAALADIAGRLDAPADAPIEALQERADAASGEDAVRARLLLRYAAHVRAFDREAFLAAPGNERARAVLDDLATRLAIVRSSTNALTYDVRFDDVQEPRRA